MAKFIKNLMLSELKKEFAQEENLIFVSFSGLDVQKSRELRQIVRGTGSVLKVVKNSLAKKTLNEAGYDNLDNFFKNETAIIKNVSDVIKLVKDLKLWNQKEKKLKIKGGVIDKKLYSSEFVESFSKFLGKYEAIVKIHNLLKGQFYRLHMSLSGIFNRFVADVKQYASQRGG